VAPSRPAARALIPALLAVALSAVLVIAILLRTVAAASAPALVDAAAGAGIAGLLVIAGAVATARAAAVGWGVALLAAAYAACVVGHGAPVDVLAPLVGLLLVLVAELSHTACEWRGPHAVDVSAERRRWARLALTAAAGTVAGGGRAGAGRGGARIGAGPHRGRRRAGRPGRSRRLAARRGGGPGAAGPVTVGRCGPGPGCSGLLEDPPVAGHHQVDGDGARGDPEGER